MAAAEGRATVEQFRAGEHHDQDGSVLRPLEQVLDEVEQSRVGPLQVLEHEHHRALLGDALEEDPPSGKKRVPAARRSRLDPKQGKQRRLDPAALLCVRDVLGDRRGDARAGRCLVVRLGQIGPAADHLAQRPEGDALAIRG